MRNDFSQSPIGPHAVPGYRSFEFTWHGERTPATAAVFESFGIWPVTFDTPVRSHLGVLRFDAFLVSQMKTRPIVYSWPRKRPDARRRYVYMMVEHGTMTMSSAAVTVTANAGEVLAAAPGSTELLLIAETDARFVFFTFDANEVRPFGFSHTDLVKVETARNVFDVVYPFLAEASRVPPYSSSVDTEVLRGLTRDVAVALLRATSPATGSNALVLVERAMLVIAENAADASYSNDRLAADLSIARRTVERAFARQGLTISGEMRAQRALLARYILQADLQLSLRDVAARSGFSTTAALRRALEQTYGATAREIRESAIARDRASGQIAAASQAERESVSPSA